MVRSISRDLIINRLPAVQRDRFLVYVMGPYKSFNLNYVLPSEAREDISIEDLPGPLRQLFQNKDDIDEAKALLRRVQGSLRSNPAVNAFLAVDIGIDTDRVDAATQSIEYATCANMTVFILPYLGHNFGVGEEAGSVLEALSTGDGTDLDAGERERVVFAKESAVSSEMIRSAKSRWDVAVITYDSESELVDHLRNKARRLVNREQFGDLDTLD
ncbi:hypothetical protein EGH21_22700 [Halomicroarcula sp. F13]|uniref:DUF7509 domain-containing protein n=1 Tax=Haloarcula rubra TaxID=2487747 RepID=A0AAW4PZ04_9EURY|nr:hypothetical protein [Halomicroarcula rubra]MBX0325831.1 hypothetical protein [Halomicroarcula rubra]